MVERLLIDANSFGHAAHQGVKLRSGDQETQAIYGTINSIRAYRMRHPDSKMVLLWDGDSWRKKESSVYKQNRTDTPEKLAERKRYKDQLPYLRKALRHLGVPQMVAGNYEADDLAGILSKRYLDAGDRVRMISGDRDWWQLLRPNCIWEDHRDAAKRVTINNLEAATSIKTKAGVTPGYRSVDQFLQAKALQGDVSDNLPGVGGIGEVKARDILDVWGSVQWFLADEKRKETYLERRGKALPKVYEAFAEDKSKHDAFFHNMRMMTLLGDRPPAERITLDKGEFNPDAFKSICHELGFASIFRPGLFEPWIEPFKTMQ